MEDGGQSCSVESEIGNSSMSEPEQGCSGCGFPAQQTYLAQVTLTPHYDICDGYLCLVGILYSLLIWRSLTTFLSAPPCCSSFLVIFPRSCSKC